MMNGDNMDLDLELNPPGDEDFVPPQQQPGPQQQQPGPQYQQYQPGPQYQQYQPYQQFQPWWPPYVQPQQQRAPMPQPHRADLTAFWTHNPRVWFTQAESAFNTCFVVDERMKFDLVVKQLAEATLEHVQSIVEAPELLERPYQAKKAGVDLTAVKDIFIYGNHSPTMFPAFAHATINGAPATSVITDSAWLQGPFCETVGKRGAAIIAARGLSSAASAANALVDHVRSLVTPGAIHSVAVKSEGRYGFDANVWAGMPVRTTTPGSYEVIEGYAMDDFAKSKIAATNKELAEERAFVASMIS